MGSERLADDDSALHVWVEVSSEIVAVGRAHLLAETSDGSGVDHAGPGASSIPPFGPLFDSSAQRPAYQIRQMGTLPEHRRSGYAALVLGELERMMVQNFGAKTGFLQAREHAIPFYQAQGWICIDKPYEIHNIGPHRSMMKLM